MSRVENKEAYFEGREMHPDLVDLYFERLEEPASILDLGCGRGSFGRGVTDAEVIGADIDRGALETAREREQVLLIDLESGTLPFADRSFDSFIAKDILEHLERPSPIVEELWRVLKPEGRGVISVPMAKPEVVWGDYTHVRGFTQSALKTLVQDHGFTMVSVAPMGGLPGAGHLNLVQFLPTLLQLPLFNRFATSHEIVVEKHSKSNY